jgi:hypothetical protein
MPVLVAVASSTAGVKVNMTTFPPKTTPKNLLQLRFNDRRVGIRTPAQLAAWRNNLALLVPGAVGAVETLTTNSTIAEAVEMLRRHLATRPQKERAPTVIEQGRWAHLLSPLGSERFAVAQAHGTPRHLGARLPRARAGIGWRPRRVEPDEQVGHGWSY